MTMWDRNDSDAETGLIAGRLLVATPLLLDPNFYRTVILVAEHSPEGALGVVLNRPTEEPVRDHLPEWAPHLSEPPVVFVGGPVANEVAVGMVHEPAIEPPEWETRLPGVGLIDLAAQPEAFGSVSRARVFSGYSGWIAGQLDAELLTDSWVVVDATVDDVFTAHPAGLWRDVLQRQPGRLALYGWFPDDLRSN
jgi:putative transcriptional regulator